MHAEIISVGTELTTGAMLDTNSQWLSLELAAIGIPVHFHTTVADDLDAMVGVLRTAAERSDLLILTGGLGPTLDDLTRQALARVLGTELVLDLKSLEFIRSIFARHNREMPERNSVQAYFPAGSKPISNPRGTAPGIWAEIPRGGGRPPSLFAALPGVPHEMKRMFLKEVVPRLPGGNQVIQRARVNCFGVGESKAEEMLGDLTARGRDPEIGITVHEATITLRIVAHGKSADECLAKIDSAKAAIRERMGEQVFGEEDEELEHVVVPMLNDRGLTFATAEIGTGGLLARRITEVAGHERCFRGGVIAPTIEALSLMMAGPSGSSGLSASPASAANVAVKSDEHAQLAAVASRCRERMGADFVLLVGKFPDYDPEDATKTAPSAYVAFEGDNVSRVVDYTFLGDMTLNKSRAAKIALNLLRLHLLRNGQLDEPPR
jgi:nicotinamide-nucleotide amidase